MERIERAQRWAVTYHKHQTRKYSGLPYIVHPEAVAEIVSEITDDPDVIAAAWMHDLIEDTEITENDIKWYFNDRVSDLVLEVSKASTKHDGCRRNRVLIDIEHYSKASKMGKIIKMADIIHNTPTIIRDDKKFALKYVSEKTMIFDVIKDGDAILSSILRQILTDFHKNP